MNILPEECARKGGNVVAPGLVERRRRVIREGLKDGLRVWVGRWVLLMQRREVEEEDEEKEGKGSVKGLVRRFTKRMLEEKEEGGNGGVCNGVMRQKRRAQVKWGREIEIFERWEERKKGVIDVEHVDGGCSQPTRVHVLGLRRFWEGVIKAASG